MKATTVILVTCVLFFTQLPDVQAQAKRTVKKPAAKSATTTKITATKSATSVATTKAAATDSTKTVKKEEPAPPPPPVKPATVQSTQVVAVTTNASPAKQPVLAGEWGNPFKKGTISFINRKNIAYTNFKNMPDNSRSSDLVAYLDFNYFLLNNFAVGVDFTYTNRSDNSATKPKYNYYSLLFNLTYGRMITPKIGAYIRATGGFGHSRSDNTIGTNDRRILDASYNTYRGTIGVPIALQQNNPVFITPYFSYDYSKTKVPNHDITDKGFSFGARLESYITGITGKSGSKDVGLWPKKGASFVEFVSQGKLGYTKRVEYQGAVRFGDTKTTNASLGVGYYYYFMDFLAAGLNLNMYYNNMNNGNGPSKDQVLGIEPSVIAHLPMEGAAHNLFLQLGYRFEKETNGFKISSGYFPVRLGYNVFLNRFLSFTPKIGYEIDHSTHKTAGEDYTYKDSGLAVDFGFRCWIK